MNKLAVSISLKKAFIGQSSIICDDVLAIERPLEIRLILDGDQYSKGKSVSITMRTPGNDSELALGFLFTEGIISESEDVERVIHCGEEKNTVKILLAKNHHVDLKKLERHFYTSSSCGVCGKSSIEALKTVGRYCHSEDDLKIERSLIYKLPEKISQHQSTFKQTGGLHASALFDNEGTFISLYEDVGRHNALDKIIGERFLLNKFPLSQNILLLSGRISFELVQKAAMAGVKFICAIGAPSSLAVELAQEFDITLVGFLNEEKLNIYHGEKRIKL